LHLSLVLLVIIGGFSNKSNDEPRYGVSTFTPISKQLKQRPVGRTVRCLAAAMWSARNLSTLQKTYDESYLKCSTAVYYESQVKPIRPGGLGQAVYDANLGG
jgi:hypothetical protein